MMDILPTQVYEDDSFMPTQQLSHSLLHDAKQKESQVGTLRIGSITYPIKQGVTQIGRHPECNIIINDQTVSKKHAEIEATSGETWICDLNSSNKTKLNNSVLRSGRYYELKGGSVVEFGMVRAVYSELGAMDESLIPETPAPSRLKTQQTIIPGTPDTSMNYSSTSEDISMIPGTQAEKGDSVFRRPSVPARSSTSNRKSYLPDSSMEDSMNDSRVSSALGKENSGERRVSIHDMETQKSLELQNDLSDDIHDVETQKICLDSFLAAKQSRDQTDIHDMETQHEEDMDIPRIVTDIHDVETQHDVDIHDLDTPKKTAVQSASAESDDGANAVEKGQTEEADLKADASMEVGKSDTKEEKSCTNEVNQPGEAVAAKDKDSGNSQQLENGQRGSQDCLELSIATNFDDESSELDRSVNLLGSQNLLENLIIDDDPAGESGSKSVSPLKSSANNNETTEKSSDEENIFDAATQANNNNENVLEDMMKRSDYTFKAPLTEDDSDDDTDQEGVFQRYSRIASQDSSQERGLSKSQSDSEDSNTDEEGHFAAMAAKEKRSASLLLEVRQNESKETKNDAGSSRDSDDLFEAATQQMNLKDSSNGQGDVSTDSVDFDAPTQVVEVRKPGDIIVKSSVDFDAPTQVVEVRKPGDIIVKSSVDFDAPTQVVEVRKPGDIIEKGCANFDSPTQVIEVSKPEDVVEKGSANFDSPTQVIEVSKPEDVVNKGSVDFDTPTQVMDTNHLINVTEKGIVNFDTPTQLIEVNEPKRNVAEEDTNKDEDDLMPTQILPTSEVSRNVTAAAKGNTTRSEDKDEDETDYNTPTQIIGEKVSIYNKPSTNGSERFNPRLVEAFGMEDIEYEMAPTQLLSDVEEKKKAASAENKNKSRRLNRVNLDDTLERNLNEMFEDVNEDIEDDVPQISTQVLTNMLESPQNKEEPAEVDVDKELPGSSVEKRVEISPLLQSKKPRRSRLKKATTNDDSQNYFSNLTTTRKRNVLVDSEEFAAISEDKVDTELEKKSTNKTINDENNISAAVLRSTPKNSPSTRLSRANTAEELKMPEPVVKIAKLAKGNKNVAEELDRGDEVSITSVDTEQSGRAITLDSDEDIMAGLPEVRISGTLSNPASPTSSTSTEFRLTTRSMRSKSVGKKTESRKKVLSKKSTRKSVARTNNEPPKVGRPRSTAFSSTFDNFDISRVPVTVCESDEDIVNEIKPTNRMSSRKSKESGSLQTKPNPPYEEVAKENLIAAKAEPMRKTTVKASRPVKRSLSSTDITDSNDAKRRKEDVIEKALVATKGRKNTRGVVATRSNSANILDYITRRDSSVLNSNSSQQSVSSIQESCTSKQLRIKITRLSCDTPTRSLSPLTPTGSANENGSSVNSATSNSSKAETDQRTTVEEKVQLTRGSRTTRAARKRNVEDASLQIGEESQEVEMIMNSWVKEQNVNVTDGEKQEETNESAKGATGRGARKRGRPRANTSEQMIENTSSEVYESGNSCFEMPTTKAKRARVSKNTTNVDNTAANESTTRGRRNVRQSSSFVNNAASKENPSNKRGRKKNVQKEEVEDKESEVTVEERTSSEINSSIDMSAILTPTRSRRSMNNSFVTSSPYKTKHRILFTGITKDYSKLLTKLGSSQVEDPTKCTVLVTDKVRRTVKFLCALAQATPIVSVSWLAESETAGHFADLDNYILKDPAAEAKFGFRLRGSLEKAKEQKLLDGYTIVLTPNVAPPPIPELKSIISACGGKPLVRPPPSWPQNAIIISREEDMANAKKFLAKAPKTVTIQSTEFILTGILRQELDFVKYKLT
ncbi:mutator 2 isoform X2 [Halictus rubicundus]|uniref:mutator 2 isoform X2 n=1 Tax=Halictus rubicundus TaxID=77578 RepID=UPI0040363676